MLSEIGLIGLGVMGKNIALNIAEKGTFVKAFNGSQEKIDAISDEFGGMFSGFTKLEELIDNLERPRNILLMIPSGQPTHSVVNQLSNLLDEGDVIIDGGNSFYQESENHGNILSSKSIEFIGMGVAIHFIKKAKTMEIFFHQSPSNLLVWVFLVEKRVPDMDQLS